MPLLLFVLSYRHYYRLMYAHFHNIPSILSELVTSENYRMFVEMSISSIIFIRKAGLEGLQTERSSSHVAKACLTLSTMVKRDQTNTPVNLPARENLTLIDVS